MGIPMKKGGVDAMKKDGFAAFTARYQARRAAGAAADQDGKTAAWSAEPAEDVVARGSDEATDPEKAMDPQTRRAQKTTECPSLRVALFEIEVGMLAEVSRIVVSRQWWDGLPVPEQDGYQRRCVQQGIELRVSDRMTRHFVEVLGASRDKYKRAD